MDRPHRKPVTPRAGAWIETPGGRREGPTARVPPWIETGQRAIIVPYGPCRPEAVKSLILRLDVDIDDLKVTSVEVDKTVLARLPANVPKDVKEQLISQGYKRLQTSHSVRDASGNEVGTTNLDIQAESDGTQKLLGLAGLWMVALRQGGVVVIDEFDARLHPFICRELVKIFQSADTNPNNAQLIFVTHGTNLLDQCPLRRDQFWFVEKSRKLQQRVVLPS